MIHICVNINQFGCVIKDKVIKVVDIYSSAKGEFNKIKIAFLYINVTFFAYCQYSAHASLYITVTFFAYCK